jgi:hypothetical protein
MVATIARAKGIPLVTIAADLDIHRNRLADKIAGRHAFKEQDIVALADYLGVPVGRLFDDPAELLGVIGGSSSAWLAITAGQRAA